MKTFNKCAAQGEVYILRVDALPATAKPIKADNGKFILGHSETGHHHVVAERPNVSYFDGGEPLVTYLQVIEAADETECLLEHLRTSDTHETIKFDVGIYKIINARESSPEGWRKVAD